MRLTLFKERRNQLGLTQVEISHLAQIALPTLQTLESGQSNPSLETLDRLGRVLGVSVEFIPSPCDWEFLTTMGLPIMAKNRALVRRSRKKSTFDIEKFVQQLRFAILEVKQQTSSTDERNRDALSSLLLAIQEHYPSFFKKNFGRNEFAKALVDHPTGKTIKLKRLALSHIAEFL